MLAYDLACKMLKCTDRVTTAPLALSCGVFVLEDSSKEIFLRWSRTETHSDNTHMISAHIHIPFVNDTEFTMTSPRRHELFNWSVIYQLDSSKYNSSTTTTNKNNMNVSCKRVEWWQFSGPCTNSSWHLYTCELQGFTCKSIFRNVQYFIRISRNLYLTAI